MPLNFYELAQSRPLERSVQETTITLKWIAMYHTSELVVYDSLLLIAPTRWDGFRRQSAKVDPQGGGVWMCDVEYGWSAQTLDSPDQPPQQDQQKPGDPLGPEWSFDGTGGTAHITQSLATISKTGRGAIVPADFKQAIGVTRDRVEGTDVPAPRLVVTLTLTFPFVSLSRIQQWSKLAGRTNDAPWFVWDTGECRYLGPQVQIQPGQMVKVPHQWECGRNLALPADKADLTIVPEAGGVGTGLVLPAKKAWEYVWCSYEDSVDANLLVQIPRSAYVERVSRSGDFSILLQGV